MYQRGIKYFITLDEQILHHSDELFSTYSLQVLRPTEFILLIDEAANSADYHSLRLAGANYHQGKLRANEIDSILDIFGGQYKNERRHEIRAKITKCAGDQETGVVRVVKDKEENKIAFYCLSIEDALVVRLLRVVSDKIAPVLFQQLVKDIVAFAIKKRIGVIRFADTRLQPWQQSILNSTGFVCINGVYHKVSLLGIYKTSELLKNEIVREYFDTGHIAIQLKQTESLSVESQKLALERKVWPAKLSDLSLPVYIIPIKPIWAAQLFDHFIAQTDLFGARPSLAWSRENVYYRSVKPVSERTPARILWYLSSDSRSVTGRRNAIVACSYLDAVYVNRVKVVFEKFKQFGIYNWHDVYQLAKQQILTDIKALKFSDTEVFQKIVPLSEVNKIMQKHKRLKNTFASPVEVSIDVFNDIYSVGTHD